MKLIFSIFFLLVFIQDVHSMQGGKGSKNIKDIVQSTFKIDLYPFEKAFNPSLCETDDGYVLTFRYLPEPIAKPWISYVGAMKLDQALNPTSSPQLLDLRLDHPAAASQAEDARIFSYNGELYIIYNDNREVTNTTPQDHREMFISKVICKDNEFSAAPPIKLIHPDYYHTRLWEKNWTPFVYNNNLLFCYSLHPSEILSLDWESGLCPQFCSSSQKIHWKWGQPRGGTPAILVDDEYLAFFHSASAIISEASEGKSLWHYLMGAYTFSKEPPFSITKISPLPIIEKSFYIPSEEPKRVIYPGGFVISGNNIYLAYGKDDHEVWIAVINKNRLMSTLHTLRN